MAQKTGRLQKGGKADEEAAALWAIQRWRQGFLGRFMLDDVAPDSMERAGRGSQGMGSSLSQARLTDKNMRRQKSRQQRLE